MTTRSAGSIRSYDEQVQIDISETKDVITLTEKGKIKDLRAACENALMYHASGSKSVELPSYYRIGLKECAKNPDDVEEVLAVLRALDVGQDEIETALEAVDELNIEL